MSRIRPCRDDEQPAILAIINAAAAAYRCAIPADRWHEPYMAAGEVDLIRHAYVLPASQRAGVGRELLAHLRLLSTRRMLVGTWAAAEWAIRFYRRNGFEQVSPECKTVLLQTYWTIPDRQIETSVVLASPPLTAA